MQTHKDPREAINRELQDLGSSLQKVEKQAGFEVPANYFEQLPGKIQDRINPTESKAEYGFSKVLNKRLIPVFAGVLLLLGLTFSLLFYEKNGKLQEYSANEESIAKYEYLAYEPSFDREMMYEVILESDISAEDILFQTENTIFDGADDDILEEIFENARYYGIEGNLLLSYLD
jgi:hypothetical protein